MPTNYDVIILGAGASGLLCAFTAAQRGRRVLVLEKANKVGKKILMSGGGKCNFTNHFVEADNFISENPHFCKAALKRYSQWDFIAMVERHGIEVEERKHSQQFCKNSAKEILTMLLDECDQAGVEIRTHCEIKTIKSLYLKGHSDKYQHEDSRIQYQLTITQDHQAHKVECQSLVVATGALSIPSLGGSSIGYDIAQQFGLALTERRAGLVPFMFSDFIKPISDSLSGLSVEVEVSCQKKSFRGGLLFTHRGLSGPAILQISNYWNPGQEIVINLLPDFDVCKKLQKEKNGNNKLLLRNFLSNYLSKSLVLELENLLWPSVSEYPIQDISHKDLIQIGSLLNHWVLKPSSTEGYRTAEVTWGGVDTSFISSKTMEVNNQPRLYFIGEVLDVTGHLGGFNFQWAWSSGYCAGLVA